MTENDIKYPIDDLDDRLAFDAAARPKLKEESFDDGFMGDVAATWTFLNVFGEPLQLDSFTLDDYIDALGYQEIDFPCDMIKEIHYALLKALVSEDEPECLVPLPQPRQSILDDTTASVQSDGDTTMEDASQGTSDSSTAAELYASLLDLRASATKPGATTWTDWRIKVQTRDFLAGGWEYAVVGILDELGNSPRLTSSILTILNDLLPPTEKRTRKNIKENYARTSARHKVEILKLLVQLVCQTPLVREHIEDCMLSMTELRKDKVDVQRERKARLEELSILENELTPFTPEESINGHDSDATEIEVPTQKRSVKASLKRKREEQEELAASIKRTKEYAKRVKLVAAKRDEIKTCEERIVNYDHDLREKDCQRLRLLGKDRFFNRYWFLEGNGQLFSGRGDTQFASARLWVQGPSMEDATYYLGGAGIDDIPEGRVSAVDITVVNGENILRERILSRKEREEGQSVLYDENQWGYYDDQEGVEGLIAWLNSKGSREAKLRAALVARKEGMYKVMEAREKVSSPPIVVC